VDLFSSRLVVRSHVPGRRGKGRALCPHCGSLPEVAVSMTVADCSDCGRSFDIDGPVRGATMTCSRGHAQRVVDALAGVPPRRRLWATLVWGEDGQREYRRPTSHDEDLVDEAKRLLVARRSELVLPVGSLEDGHNTRQVMRWGYQRWEQLFSDRQLYSLGLLGAAVRDLPHCPEREALAALFSGTLEFNNLLCSYKGEGTGAVRHAFAHHVLRPERVPLEAHPWGTVASSGSFSTLFSSRLLRAHNYKGQPHDLVPGRGKYGGTPTRVVGRSRPLAGLHDDVLQWLQAPAGARTPSGGTEPTPGCLQLASTWY
jgi:putative DNA methylase